MTRLSLILLLFLAGCSSTPPPERAYYLLRAEGSGELAPADPDAQAGLGRVELAPYLDRAGVVVQLDEQRVREARYHLWAEPLDQGIAFYLGERISRLLGRELNTGAGADSWQYRIDISIEEFHGTLDGEARLIVRWSLINVAKRRMIVTQRLSLRKQQTADSYAGLVQTQTALLDDLAEHIARALRDVSA